MASMSKIMSQLKAKGSAQTRKIYTNHGAPTEMYGVKVADLKVIAKSIKGEQELAYDLYDTGNVDAMYLAGLVADGKVMTKQRLDKWARNSAWYMISEYAVPFVSTQHDDARGLAMKWMKSKKECVASAGWATYAGLLATSPDKI